QERFLYILVDEFQDTNGSQEEIVRLLASYWDSPNLFIVGDDDQSIYEFQGARLKSMLDFYERYDGVEVITLRENYRSDQILLDTAAYLIDQNEQRLSKLIDELSIDKHLLSASGDSGFKPQIRHYANADQELMAVVNQIHSWREQGGDYGQMAVIYARHQQANLLKQLLERSGIPYQTKRRPNVLDTLSIRQLRELLTYLDLEDRLPGSGQHLLFRILHFGCFGLEASDLALLALARRRPEVQDAAETWRAFLSRPDLWPAGIQAANNVQQVAATLERLQAELHQQPLARFIDTVLSQSGMLAYYAKKTDRLMRLLELRTFVAFLERECLRQPRTDLRKFLSTLSGMDANRIEMPLLALSENTQAVQLLTAHSAKGLEFDYVWMYDCVEKQWGEGRSANNQRFKLPPTITYSGEEDALEAKRRLFYVAMTRSKKELVMSYASQNQAGKPVQAVQFLIAMIKELGISGEVLDQGGFDLAAYLGVQLGLDRVRIEPPVKTDLIGEFLKDFRVSVSALHTWLDCPLAFFYERVLQLPRIQRPAAVYGESLHEALQNYFLIVRDENQEGWPSKEKLVSLFERALAKRRAWLETRDYDEYLRRGRRELATYFDHERSNWISSVSVEQYIGHVDIEGVPAVAVIDRIDHIAKNRVAIVDYKTGFANQRHTRPPSDGKPAGGAYWRQLVFYKMIFEAHERGLVDVESCSLSYLTIGPDGQQAKVEMKVKQKDDLTHFLLILLLD
ncbi:MAG: ATP-dependent DNA helicase, partial [Bacteroidota bacterium]